MSAVLEAQEPRAGYLAALQPPLVRQFDLLATAPGGVARLRELILTLAVQGKLVPQDPADEPARVLLQKIRAEKDRLIAAGKFKRDKPLSMPDEDEQPFEIPFDWEWVRFGDLAIISGGVTLGRKGSMAKPISLPYLRVANVQRWRLDLNLIKEVVIDQSEIERYQLLPGDLLITEGGDWDKVGRTAIWRDEISSCLHQNHVFKARGPENAWNPAWAELYLNSPVARAYFAASAKQTTNLASINMAELRGCVFPLPPLAEQSRIVTRVEELMRLCDALESQRQLEAAQHAQLLNTLLCTLTDSTSPDELAANWQRVSDHFDLLLDRPEAVDALEQIILQLAVRGLLVPQDPSDEPASVLLQKIRAEKDRLIAEGKIKRDKPRLDSSDDELSFDSPTGWEWVRFGEIVQISSGVTLGRKTSMPAPVSLPYLRVANVQRWYLSLDSMKEVLVDKSELPRFQLASGDLLIAEGGDWDKVGRTAIWREELSVCVHQNHVFKARGISQDWNPVWAELYLNSLDARAYFAASAKQTTNLASINMTELRGCVFPLPPLAEQTRIVARIKQLRGLCTDLRLRLSARQSTQMHLAEALVEM